MEFEIIVSLLTLIALETVLGLDNVIFLSILASRLPEHQQKKARRYGLIFAMVSRLALLAAISWIMKLKAELFNVFGHGISGKDLILIVGGIFLLYKSATEIYHKMEGESGDKSKKITAVTFMQVMLQVLILDMVFSIDSIITAVGMVDELWVMYVAVIVTVGIMMFAAEPISRFIEKHPAFKILALSFLMMIGLSLVAEGFDIEIPKGYIYFAMLFSLLVDIVQMRVHARSSKPVKTHEHYDKLPKDLD